ncbi:MAG: ATP-grasp domain-containing protein [Bacteriovoracaceae bacterium]
MKRQKVIILAKNPEITTNQLVEQAFLTLGINCYFLNPEADFLESVLSNHKLEKQKTLIWNRYGAYDYQDQDKELLQKLRDDHYKLINGSVELFKLRSKNHQFHFFKSLGLDTIETIDLSERNFDYQKLEATLKQDKRGFVLKTIRGMSGKGVNFFQQTPLLLEKIKEILDSNDRNYVLQPLIKAKHEVRVIFFNQRPLIFITKKTLAQGPRFNYSEDTEFLVESYCSQKHSRLDLGLIQNKRIPLEFFAIDFLIDHQDRSYFLELNTVPGLASVQEASPQLFAEILQKIVSN